MRKIIIVCHDPLTNKIKSNFYIDNFIQQGFFVEYWDVSQYVSPGIVLADQIKGDFIKKFDLLTEIENSLKKEDLLHTVFVVEVQDNWKNRFLYKLLSDYQCYSIRIDMYGNTALKISLVQKLKSMQFRRLLEMFRNQLEMKRLEKFKKVNHIKSFEAVFSSSVVFENRIPINHPDYERYIDDPEIKDDNYIVFLDIYYPLHPDIVYRMNLKGVVTEKYQLSLKQFFDRVEKQYEKNVIIAAHPKSEYKGNEFGNRKIVKGITELLVKNSSMVFLHYSNSISYVVLYDKPMAFISNDEFNKGCTLRNTQRKWAAIFNLPIINIDRDFNMLTMSKLDRNIRNEYIYSYLTSKAIEKQHNFPILLGYISGL